MVSKVRNGKESVDLWSPKSSQNSTYLSFFYNDISTVFFVIFHKVNRFKRPTSNSVSILTSLHLNSRNWGKGVNLLARDGSLKQAAIFER